MAELFVLGSSGTFGRATCHMTKTETSRTTQVKRRLLKAIYTLNRTFTKTGSGQTYEKPTKVDVFFSQET
jgi:hypothetical protein